MRHKTPRSKRFKYPRKQKRHPLIPLINGLSICLLMASSLIIFSHYSKSEIVPKLRLEFVKPPSIKLPTIKAEHRKREWKWYRLYNQINHRVESDRSINLVFYGDSLTQGWNNNPAWRSHYGRRNALNAGIWSDRTQHLLWRLQNGNIGRSRPKVAVVLIGGNNLMIESPNKVAGGIKQIVTEIQKKSPKTKILLVGILPGGRDAKHPRRTRAKVVNKIIKTFADGDKVRFIDFGNKLLTSSGLLSQQVSPDSLHLTQFGYQIMAEALEPSIAKMLGQEPMTIGADVSRQTKTRSVQ